MNKEPNAVNKNAATEQLNIAASEQSPVKGVSKRRAAMFILIAGICIILSVFLVVGLAFSWFQPPKDADVKVHITDFSAYTKIGLSNSTKERLADSHQIKVGSTGANVGTLKLDIHYTGRSSAYIRVQLFESFKNSSGALYPATDVNYTLSSGWVEYDGFYYYHLPVAPAGRTDTEISVPFVTGASTNYNTSDYNGVYFNLVSVVEAVQPDRFDEFFGISYEEVFGGGN